MADSALDRVLKALLGWLSDDARVRRNVLWMTLAALLSACSGILSPWYLFITKLDLAREQMNLPPWFESLAGLIAFMAFLGLADYVQRRVRAYVLATMGVAVVPLVMAGLALLPRPWLQTSLGLSLLIALGCGRGIVTAFITVVGAAVLVRAVPVPIRGRFITIAWLVGGLGALAGLPNLSKAAADADRPVVWTLLLLAASGLVFLQARSYAKVSEVPELAVPGASRSPLPFTAAMDIARLREFRRIAPPLVLHGIIAQVAPQAVAIAIRRLALPGEYPQYTAAAAFAGGLLAMAVIFLVADRCGAARTTLLAGVLTAAGMGTMMPLGNPVAFVASYGLMQLGLQTQTTAVYLGVLNTVPPGYMGGFFGAQQLLRAGAMWVAAPAIAFCADRLSPVLFFALVAALHLANGVWFWRAFGGRTATIAEESDQGRQVGAAGQ